MANSIYELGDCYYEEVGVKEWVGNQFEEEEEFRKEPP